MENKDWNLESLKSKLESEIWKVKLKNENESDKWYVSSHKGKVKNKTQKWKWKVISKKGIEKMINENWK